MARPYRVVPDADLGHGVRLARAASELTQIYRLRYEVYVEEMNTFGAVADHSARLLRDPGDDGSRLLTASLDGRVIGTLRLTFGSDGPFGADVEDTYSLTLFAGVAQPTDMVVFSRLIVARAHRRGPVPGRLLAAGARMTYDQDAELAFCDCSPHLLGFYHRLGFRSYRSPYVDPHLALQVPLVMITNDVAYLRQIGSPVPGWRPDRPWPSRIARQSARLLSRMPSVPTGEAVRAWLTEPVPELLTRLSDAELTRLLAGSHVLDLAAGDCLMLRGQALRTMYVVLVGTVEAREDTGWTRTVGPGEVVGEIAFLLDGGRTRDVYAGPDGATVLSLHEPTMRQLLAPGGNPGALLTLCATLARRLAE
jgi:predicted GNAT family N-acyltransferase